MTDLQIKYWQLQEEKRANREQEALKSRDVASQESLRASQVTVNEQEAAKISQETENLNHELDLIDAKTELTEQQKKTEKANTVNKWVEAIVGILDPFGVLRGFGGGLGKGLGQGTAKALFG